MGEAVQSRSRVVRETIAAAGVILGLVFVGHELRQNTNVLKSEAIQATAEMSRAHAALAIESTELRQAVRSALGAGRRDALSVDEQSIVTWWFLGAMRVQENRYQQLQLGALSAHTTVGGTEALYRSQYFREWWDGRKSEYTPDFRSWMDREVIGEGS